MTSEDANISEEKFICYLNALQDAHIIESVTNNSKDINDYIIIDPIKFTEWSRSNFYRAIEKYVLPFMNIR